MRKSFVGRRRQRLLRCCCLNFSLSSYSSAASPFPACCFLFLSIPHFHNCPIPLLLSSYWRSHSVPPPNSTTHLNCHSFLEFVVFLFFFRNLSSHALLSAPRMERIFNKCPYLTARCCKNVSDLVYMVTVSKYVYVWPFLKLRTYRVLSSFRRRGEDVEGTA